MHGEHDFIERIRELEVELSETKREAREKARRIDELEAVVAAIVEKTGPVELSEGVEVGINRGDLLSNDDVDAARKGRLINGRYFLGHSNRIYIGKSVTTVSTGPMVNEVLEDDSVGYDKQKMSGGLFLSPEVKKVERKAIMDRIDGLPVPCTVVS
jgi:hypothetical protein